MSDPRGDGSKLGLFLGLVYSLQGRIEDRQRVIVACWDRLNAAGEGASEQSILLVRLYIQTPTTAEIRAFLDSVARMALEDDRVWLGRAKLAIRDGAYDEAARWLDDCVRRRPDDVAVWRARLDWALATRRLADVRRSLGHLPVAECTPAEVQRLTAWLAAFRGNLDSERRALERLVEVDPADLAALDRLAAIEDEERKPERIGECRHRKEEIGRLQARYEKLYRRNQTLRDANEMAGLAEQLGRPFEAKVFMTIAMAEGSMHRDPTVRSVQHVPSAHPRSGTLAELLAEELAAADRAKAR
jgi:tetratricopeptide (TPR) repeat protein